MDLVTRSVTRTRRDELIRWARVRRRAAVLVGGEIERTRETR